jgi:hypothetical protein
MSIEEVIAARVKEVLAGAPRPTPEFVAGFVALMRGFRREDQREARHVVDEDAA